MLTLDTVYHNFAVLKGLKSADKIYSDAKTQKIYVKGWILGSRSSLDPAVIENTYSKATEILKTPDDPNKEKVRAARAEAYAGLQIVLESLKKKDGPQDETYKRLNVLFMRRTVKGNAPQSAPPTPLLSTEMLLRHREKVLGEKTIAAAAEYAPDEAVLKETEETKAEKAAKEAEERRRMEEACRLTAAALAAAPTALPAGVLSGQQHRADLGGLASRAGGVHRVQGRALVRADGGALHGQRQ